VSAAISVVDVEAIVEKAVKAAVQVVKDEFSKLLKDVQDYCSLLEERIASLESNAQLSHSNTYELNLTARLDAISEENRRTALATNDLEQFGRRRNIRIKGLQVKADDDCRKVITNFVQTKLQVHIKEDDIEVAHTLPVRRVTTQSQSNTSNNASVSATANYNSTIIVRFRDIITRDKVIRQRKLLKSTKVTVIEDLTNLNVELMNRLRRSDDVEKCWSWNGHVFAMLKNGKKVRVRPFQTIQEVDI